jgi:hypothetical protein
MTEGRRPPNKDVRLAALVYGSIAVVLILVLGWMWVLGNMGDPAKGEPLVIENRLDIDLYIQTGSPSAPERSRHFFTAVDAHSSDEVTDGCEWRTKLVAREWILKDELTTEGAEEGDLGQVIEILLATAEGCLWVIDGN